MTEQHPGIKTMNNYFDVKERKPFEYLHICHWNVGFFSRFVFDLFGTKSNIYIVALTKLHFLTTLFKTHFEDSSTVEK